MEDTDDFELVDNDNDRIIFDPFMVNNEEDDGGLLTDELDTKVTKQSQEIQKLEKHLKSQVLESQKLIKSLKAQSTSNLALESKLKEELKEVEQLKTSLSDEKEQIVAQRKQMSDLLESMVDVPSTISKSKQIMAELNHFYSNTSTIEAELDKLKAMRLKQQEMINQCKVNIEQINAHARECVVSLDKCKSFACKECGTDIALKEDIESKCYQVGQGTFTEKKRGYLFGNAVNTVLGATKTENFTTGSYQISWVSCVKCSHQMGWKYISADNPNNNAKVGKYCLARYSLTSPEDRVQQK